MASWLAKWFGYGLGAAAGKAIFDERRPERGETADEPVRQQTEAEIREDEKRYDAEAKRLEAEADAEKAAKKRGRRSG